MGSEMCIRDSFILAYAGAFVNWGLTERRKLHILYIYHMNSEREHDELNFK